MSTLMERRLQLLLDQKRFDLVSAEAKRSGRSISAVIRGAIDLAFPSDVEFRMAAAAEFLKTASVGTGVEDDWATIKGALEADVESRLR